MARRKMGKRGSFRGGFKKFRKKVSTSGSTENLLITAGAAAVYGGLRQRIETWIAPVTSKVPLGGYSDEILLGTLGYFMAKGKIPVVNGKVGKSIGKAVMIIEAARIGSGIAGQMFGGVQSTNNLDQFDNYNSNTY